MASKPQTAKPKNDIYAGDGGLFGRLREACAAEWKDYTEHRFVRGLADGSLPETAFQYYLAQDYLFLTHFARAYGLAVYKSDSVDDMRQAAGVLTGILDMEMTMHVVFASAWGLTEAQMAAQPEDSACIAYTRYVLETGMAGDLLDLHTALAPCIIGYGEIGRRLAPYAMVKGKPNPYKEWIDMYAGEEYQQVAAAEIAQLDRLFAARGGENRFDSLAAIFREATRLEADFWQMGVDNA